MTVRNGVAIYYRDTANLTLQRIRTQIFRALAEKDVTLDERVLIALDEACRTRRGTPPKQKSVRDGAPDFSGKVIHLADVQREVTFFLPLRDPDLLPVTLGAKAAHRFGGSPVWLLLVAPPSGVKTEVLRLIWDTPGIYPLSELTARTFASGLDTQGADPSLLARLRDEVLLLKDFTTVLSMHRDERQAILAQLREIYDGRYDKTWGTGKELHWEGRLGFLAGVTPIIDSHHSVMSGLGERFVLFSIDQADRQEVACMALNNIEAEGGMRQRLSLLVKHFMAGLPDTPPAVSSALRNRLATMATFVTRCRSGVERDGYKRELVYAPEPEMPARLAKQLFELLRGVALVCDHTDATDEDMSRVERVALDCIPAVRRTVLRAVAEVSSVEGTLTTTQVAQGVQYSTTTVRRALEDLQALGVLSVTKGGQGMPDRWHPREEWREALDTLKKVESALESRRSATFPEKSGAPSHNKVSHAERDTSGDPDTPDANGRSGTSSSSGTTKDYEDF